MVTNLRQTASEFKYNFQYEIPVKVLAQKVGQNLQKYSQYSGIRPFCAQITLVGIDEEFGPQCFRIDPSGQVIGFKAVSTGSKEQEAMSQLEKQLKKLKPNEQWDSRQTVEVAITVLQAVTSSDFKSNEVEVGYINKESGVFRKLTENEIDNVLTDLADKN